MSHELKASGAVCTVVLLQLLHLGNHVCDDTPRPWLAEERHWQAWHVWRFYSKEFRLSAVYLSTKRMRGGSLFHLPVTVKLLSHWTPQILHIFSGGGACVNPEPLRVRGSGLSSDFCRLAHWYRVCRKSVELNVRTQQEITHWIHNERLGSWRHF